MGGAVRNGHPRHDEGLDGGESPQRGNLDQMGGETQVLVVQEGLWVEVDELMLRAE